MNEQVWWYVARSTGLVAWALAAASVLWGMALSTRALGTRPKPAWLLDLHRFLGGLTIVFVAAHVGALVADSYVHFGPADVLVPMASGWKPGPVAWGIVALYLLVAVEVTSLLMKRLPRRLWKAVHLSSYGLYATATVHTVTAGTDAGNPLVQWVALLSVLAVVFFTVYLLVAPKRRSAASPKPAATPSRSPTDRSAAIAAAKARLAAAAASTATTSDVERDRGDDGVLPEEQPALEEERALVVE